MKTGYYLDIPTRECVGNPGGSWEHIETFDSKEKALAFIREHFGPCDENGNVCLLTEGQP